MVWVEVVVVVEVVVTELEEEEEEEEEEEARLAKLVLEMDLGILKLEEKIFSFFRMSSLFLSVM
jgi:hypothetical protein